MQQNKMKFKLKRRLPKAVSGMRLHYFLGANLVDLCSEKIKVIHITFAGMGPWIINIRKYIYHTAAPPQSVEPGTILSAFVGRSMKSIRLTTFCKRRQKLTRLAIERLIVK